MPTLPTPLRAPGARLLGHLPGLPEEVLGGLTTFLGVMYSASSPSPARVSPAWKSLIRGSTYLRIWDSGSSRKLLVMWRLSTRSLIALLRASTSLLSSGGAPELRNVLLGLADLLAEVVVDALGELVGGARGRPQFYRSRGRARYLLLLVLSSEPGFRRGLPGPPAIAGTAWRVRRDCRSAGPPGFARAAARVVLAPTRDQAHHVARRAGDLVVDVEADGSVLMITVTSRRIPMYSLAALAALSL